MKIINPEKKPYYIYSIEVHEDENMDPITIMVAINHSWKILTDTRTNQEIINELNKFNKPN